MSDESANPSCISHLSIGTNDFPVPEPSTTR